MDSFVPNNLYEDTQDKHLLPLIYGKSEGKLDNKWDDLFRDAHRVLHLLLSSPGLDEVVIRYASQTFKGTIDQDVFNLQLLVDKLAQAGYTLKPEKETVEDDLLANEKALKSQRTELLFTPLFALPLLYLGMTHKTAFPYLLIQGVLALILSGYFGRNIHRKAFSLIKIGRFNMDTLISLGSIAAYGYSV